MSFSAKQPSLGEQVVRNLELVAQINGNLQVLRMNPEWSSLLENKARIREAVSSIGVEGTVISLAQAKTVAAGQDDPDIGEKERREFIGYYESLEFVKTKTDSELTLGLLLSIHEKITAGDAKALPGKIRVEQNAIKRHGQIIYTPPPVSQLDFLLREFFIWFNRTAEDKECSPITAAAICHFWFVWIHPFADGNGRVGRLLTTFLLLKKQSESVRYFALSDYYNRHQDEYYDALKETNKCDPRTPAMNFDHDLTPWISFFVKSFLAQSKEIKEITNRILQLNIRVEHLREEGLITERQNKVLSLLYSQEKASYKELSSHLGGVTMARISQLLKPLRTAGILIEEKIGKILWFKLGSPEDEPREDALPAFKKKLKRKSIAKKQKETEKDAKQVILPIFEDEPLS